MARGPKIGPLTRDERLYAAALRREILNPMRAQARLAIVAARADYNDIRRWIIQARAQAQLLDPVAEAEARRALGRIEAGHRKRFTKLMRRHIGVRVDLIEDAAFPLTARIADNVRLIKTIPERFHQGMLKGLLNLGATEPFDQEKVMALLRKEYRSTGYNLRRLTRDQTSKLVGQLNHTRQTQVGVTHYEWVTSNDERVRRSHVNNEGLTFAWDSPPPDTGHPGDDVQCFPGSVRICAAGLEGSVAYRYVGELVEIRLADGIDVSATPNHPILTETGWKRAGDLSEGDKLAKHRGGGDFCAGGLDPEFRNGYASAQQLHVLLGGRIDEHGAHGRAIDLHGQPATDNEQVDVVAAPRVLRDRFDALGREMFGDLRLEPAAISSSLLADDGGPVTDLGLPSGVADLLVGGAGEGAALIGGHGVHADLVGLAGGADGQPQVVEAGSDHVAADPEGGRDLFHRLLGVPSVADDAMERNPTFVVARVAAVRRVHHDGLVHSFQTATGLIVANGIVTHNCRCVAVAVIPEPAPPPVPEAEPVPTEAKAPVARFGPRPLTRPAKPGDDGWAGFSGLDDEFFDTPALSNAKFAEAIKRQDRANPFAKQPYGIPGTTLDVSVRSGLNNRVRGEVAKTFDWLTERYPLVRANVSEVKGNVSGSRRAAASAIDFSRDVQIQDVRKSLVGTSGKMGKVGDPVDWTLYNRGRISFSSGFKNDASAWAPNMGDGKTMVGQIGARYGANWGIDTAHHYRQSAIVHEFGHHVAFTAAKRFRVEEMFRSGSGYAPQHSGALLRRWEAMVERNRTTLAGETNWSLVSKYAATNIDEFSAESFTAVAFYGERAPLVARLWVKEMVEAVDAMTDETAIARGVSAAVG